MDIKLATVGGKHIYTTPAGKVYPSVTTILAGTRSREDTQSLDDWRGRVGSDVADYIRDESMAVGTEVHRMNECFLLHRPYDGGVPRLISDAHHRVFRPTLEALSDVIAIETRLYSDQYRMAGTVDCIARYDGALTVIDYKTKRSPQRREWLDGYFMQMSAYSVMWEELHGTRIDRLLLLASSEKNTFQKFEARRKDFLPAFLLRLQAYRDKHRFAPDPSMRRMRVP